MRDPTIGSCAASFFKKDLTNRADRVIINKLWYSNDGGIAQLARALGSYPGGRWFKSCCRYPSARWSRGQDTALSRRNHGFDSRTGHQA